MPHKPIEEILNEKTQDSSNEYRNILDRVESRWETFDAIITGINDDGIIPRNYLKSFLVGLDSEFPSLMTKRHQTEYRHMAMKISSYLDEKRSIEGRESVWDDDEEEGTLLPHLLNNTTYQGPILSVSALEKMADAVDEHNEKKQRNQMYEQS